MGKAAMSAGTIDRKIARDISREANFCGSIQLVYDITTGKRVGCFPGGNTLVHLWSEWDGETMICIRGGNGIDVTPEYVASLSLDAWNSDAADVLRSMPYMSDDERARRDRHEQEIWERHFVEVPSWLDLPADAPEDDEDQPSRA